MSIFIRTWWRNKQRPDPGPTIQELQLIILEEIRDIMADFTAFNAALTKLQSDVAALEAAVAAAGAAATAADQAAVDSATASINTLDASVVAATPAPPAA